MLSGQTRLVKKKQGSKYEVTKEEDIGAQAWYPEDINMADMHPSLVDHLRSFNAPLPAFMGSTPDSTPSPAQRQTQPLVPSQPPYPMSPPNVHPSASSNYMPPPLPQSSMSFNNAEWMPQAGPLPSVASRTPPHTQPSPPFGTDPRSATQYAYGGSVNVAGPSSAYPDRQWEASRPTPYTQLPGIHAASMPGQPPQRHEPYGGYHNVFPSDQSSSRPSGRDYSPPDSSHTLPRTFQQATPFAPPPSWDETSGLHHQSSSGEHGAGLAAHADPVGGLMHSGGGK